MADIIVCCAQKGGCAKTVTTHNLAYALSRMGRRVLAVDLDTQANLTTCFGIDNPASLPVSIADLLDAEIHDEELPPANTYLQHCGGIDLIASSPSLSVVSDSLRMEMGSERFLADILHPLRTDYDYILVDTGPKLDNLCINALVAADRLVIPVNPQYLSTTGLNALIGTIRKVRHRFNRSLEVAGILLTMCDNRTNLCRMLSEQIREEYQAYMPIFDAAVPMTVKVGEAVYYSRSVVEYAPNCSAAIAYWKAAEELDAKSNRLRLPKTAKETAAPHTHRKEVNAL